MLLHFFCHFESRANISRECPVTSSKVTLEDVFILLGFIFFDLFPTQGTECYCLEFFFQVPNTTSPVTCQGNLLTIG